MDNPVLGNLGLSISATFVPSVIPEDICGGEIGGARELI
jgi:hypothetical protein